MASVRRRAIAVAIAAVAAGGAVFAAPSSNAQDNPLLDPLTTTTVAPPASSSTTATTAAPTGDQLGNGSTQAPAGAKDLGGDGAAVPKGGIVVPPEAQKIINAVHRTGPSNDADLVAAVHQLVDLGMTDADAYRVGMGRFPVAGPAKYTDDWLYPRYGPGFRFHLGCDVFAAMGTPLRAPVDGVATTSEDALGGLTVKVTMPDKTYFYLAHLSALVAGFANGMAVKTGDIVGYVGDSGNAKGGAPHVHVGVYPKGRGPVDPKPILDKFLVEAKAFLPQVVAAYEAAHPTVAAIAVAPLTESAEQRLLRPTLATAFLHPLAAGGDGLSPAALYLLANDPVGGGRQLVQGELDDLAATIDWTTR
jgi:murein DD-endopeptidase MepM/ murein hydrolase activator NlpD